METNIQTNTQTNKQTNKQTYKQTNIQTNIQTNKQTFSTALYIKIKTQSEATQSHQWLAQGMDDRQSE
jgi:hypothetical protein